MTEACGVIACRGWQTSLRHDRSAHDQSTLLHASAQRIACPSSIWDESEIASTATIRRTRVRRENTMLKSLAPCCPIVVRKNPQMVGKWRGHLYSPAFGSTGMPESSHARHPPMSARAFFHPACLSESAARALVASSIQAQ